MDIYIALDYLGLSDNRFKLNRHALPHHIVEWDGPDNQPTEAELQAAYDAAITEESWNELRAKRNQLLAETDYLALSDVTLSTEMAEYRQALRDLPTNTTDPANPSWPVKPK